MEVVYHVFALICIFIGRLRVDFVTLVGLRCPSAVRLSVRPQEVSLTSVKFGM